MGASEAQISVRNLRKEFDNVTPIKNVSFDVHKGDVISIIGPSGTGKSTLLRCINQLDPPTSGKVIFNGKDLTDPGTDLSLERRMIGMVFQSFNLFSHRMVIENIMMPQVDLLGKSKQEAYDEGVKQLRVVGLAEKLHTYPDELSGGQKQRVAIARCLAMHPDVILFDEPTSALDPTMVGEVESVIGELARQGLTMMVVTHDMKFSRQIANRIFYLDEGVLYEEGTPEEIFDNPRRKKTRAFVKRLSSLTYEIESSDFDLYELIGKVDTFCSHHYLSAEMVNNTELVLEELLVNKIVPKTGAATVSVDYFEVDNQIELAFSYGGASYDPFLDAPGDDVSMKLVDAYSPSHKHSFENDRNDLTVEIAGR